MLYFENYNEFAFNMLNFPRIRRGRSKQLVAPAAGFAPHFGNRCIRAWISKRIRRNTRNYYQILIAKPEGKSALGRLRRKWDGGGGVIIAKVVKKLGKKRWTRSNWLVISSNCFCENGTELLDSTNVCIFLTR
jgi:hypothetical protein